MDGALILAMKACAVSREVDDATPTREWTCVTGAGKSEGDGAGAGFLRRSLANTGLK